MKRIAIAGAVLGTVFLGSLGAANALEFNVGPGGVYVGPNYHWRHHEWRGDYAYAPGCRTIVTNRINRFGEQVTVRRKICD